MNPTLSIVDDQFGSPTYCLDLAIFVRELIETDRYGFYHASNQGVCSRYEFAVHILKRLGWRMFPFKPVPTHLFPPAPAAETDVYGICSQGNA